ncbi:MAG: 1-deoxy-D-xylulose-5-phosphate reductoisomerase [Candidatus Hydrogenedentes bacterium CG1_02_42_14]|nr:MAG: 1-deoxy-D-xylulose-5-phosphate reductoisomerase [Candidatus Hydrogenedentes bacterium CG1_02_42_14]
MQKNKKLNDGRIRIAIFGCTGSIGKNTIDVVKTNSARIKITALAAGRNEKELLRLADELKVSNLALASKSKIIPSGEDALRTLAATADYDIAVNAVVGSAGLSVTLGALDAGKDIALANKESLVMAGDYIMRLAKARGVRIFPIDSEHSSLQSCLKGRDADEIRRVFLTASGGPFRGRRAGTFDNVTVEEALNHPTWKMGPKITIDSSTLINKGLEIIEAHYLFNLPQDKIEVVIHPQSIIHAMAEHNDGTIIAELAPPDMRIPIQRALLNDGVFSSPLDLLSIKALTFEKPDEEAFPSLKLARKALRMGGTAPLVLNAANEVAVQSFLEKRIHFGSINDIIAKTLEAHNPQEINSESDIMIADQWARDFAGGDRLLKELEN